MFRKLLAVLGLLCAICVSSPRAAHAGSVTSQEIGESSTTAFVPITVGTGILLDISKSSGTAGDYTVCFDSGSVSGLTLTLSTPANGSTMRRLPALFVSTTSTTTNWPARMPALPYSHGLMCANSSNGKSFIIYRPD